MLRSLVVLTLVLGTTLPACARPGAPLAGYQGFLAKILKLKPAGVSRVEGGTASDWLYTFKGRSPKGLPLQATVQVGNQRVYSQALTMTARSKSAEDTSEVARLSLLFWQEATGGNGKAVEAQIAHQIQMGAGEAQARQKNLLLTLSRLPAAEKTIWVAGAETMLSGGR